MRAWMSATWPTWIGARNAISSNAAVTTGRRNRDCIADFLADELARVVERPVGGDVDRVLAEEPAGEHRQRDQRVVALGAQGDIARERHLRDVPFAEAGEAGKDFLDRQVDVGDVEALGPDLAGEDVAEVIVVAQGDGDGDVGHGGFPELSGGWFDLNLSNRESACRGFQPS